MEKKRPVYVDGMIALKRRESAPHFVVAEFIVSIDELKKFLEEMFPLYGTTYNEKRQLRIQLVEGQDRPYCIVNTFKPDGKKPRERGKYVTKNTKPADEDIPF